MTRNRKRTPRRGKSDANQASGSFLFVSLSVIGLLLGVHIAKIWLQHRTSNMGLEWEDKSRQISQLRDEQANLTMQKESFTDGSYILDRARILGLEAPSPGQVRRLREVPAALEAASLDDDPDAAPTGDELASSLH